ncbi:MAG: hypothetical protein OQK66_03190 [Prosthecochloris sp.]|uniref:hypothetical protein n=1 Tax=Prosthecochloris sp. TaxID=290513 RepID=UPI00258E65F4|nr:hypothetical protein [Prosthecochloris sp.]MCW8797957.1 hypothetical protein [Prosthecochloris sp.]
MDISRIVLNDDNPQHRELAIYRTGTINQVRLVDESYIVYDTLEVSAHNHSALFHFGLVEALNRLVFISESGHGLDSWDEAFLHHSQIESMTEIIDECGRTIEPGKTETIMLGWHKEPLAVSYWREIKSDEALSFLDDLRRFAQQALQKQYDLEFIL